jgi:hypothetical protein
MHKLLINRVLHRQGSCKIKYQISDKGWALRNDVRQPNILIAVLDDVGFADLSCYGSEYAMPFS